MAQTTVAYKLSDSVVLTKKGKAMKQQAVLPTSLKLDGRSFGQTGSAGKSDCELKSATSTATAKTGSTIYLPSYGRQTPPMTVTCTSGGKTKSKTVNAVNRTTEAFQSQAAMHMLVGFGLVGAMITAGQADARDKALDIYGYPSQIHVK